MPVASDRHAARLAFQRVSVLIADSARVVLDVPNAERVECRLSCSARSRYSYRTGARMAVTWLCPAGRGGPDGAAGATGRDVAAAAGALIRMRGSPWLRARSWPGWSRRRTERLGTHKGQWCQEGMGYRPGGFAWCCRAGPDCSSGSSSQLPWFTSPCWRGQAGAPAAAQRRGRTSLRPASGDGSWEAGKIVFVLVLRVVFVPGVAGGVVSQAPIRRRPQRAGPAP